MRKFFTLLFAQFYLFDSKCRPERVVCNTVNDYYGDLVCVCLDDALERQT